MRPTPAVSATLVAAALLLAPAPGASAAQDDPVTSVRISDSGFSGKVAKVRVGDTVTWVNKGTTAHLPATTKGPVAFASPKLAAGESWSFTFRKAGRYTYVCRLHPAMTATVVAAAAVTKASKAAEPITAAKTGTGGPGGTAGAPKPLADASAAPATGAVLAADVDTEGGRSALILFGSLAAVGLLGALARHMPSPPGPQAAKAAAGAGGEPADRDGAGTDAGPQAGTAEAGTAEAGTGAQVGAG